MITVNGKEITSFMSDGVMWEALYRGGELIWQAVRSCFGSGRWINEKPWINTEAWKN